MKKNNYITFLFCLIALNMKGQVIRPDVCSVDSTNKLIYTNRDIINDVLPALGPPSTPPPPPTFGPSDYRMVYWVHGMNGEASAWAKVASASSNIPLTGSIPGFRPRKIFSLLPDYSNVQLTLTEAQTHLSPQLLIDSRLPNNYDKEKSFIVAHSQGGLTTRSLIYQDDMQSLPHKFGGFVTFGTPHRGAMALTGLNKELGYKFFKTAAEDLSAGPVQEFQNIINQFNNSFFLRLFNYQINLSPNQLVKDFIESSLFRNPITKQNGFLLELISKRIESGISNEMCVGCPSLNTLNAHNQNMSSVAFYGVKKAYVHPANNGKPDILVEPFWALMHYSINSVNDNDYFQAYDDYMLAEKAREAELDYIEKYHHHKNQFDVWFNCSCIFKQKKRAQKLLDHTAALLKYNQGRAWFRQANKLWETAIGAHSEQNRLTLCECQIKNTQTQQVKQFLYGPLNNTPCGTNIQYNITGPIDWQVWQIVSSWTSTYKKVIVIKDHDGAALAESVRDLPFMTDDMIVDGVNVAIMNGSGHMQMRNDGNTKDKLNLIFDGKVGTFFYTEKIP